MAKEGPGKPFTAKAAEVLLAHVAEQQSQAFDAVGLVRLTWQCGDMIWSSPCRHASSGQRIRG